MSIEISINENNEITIKFPENHTLVFEKKKEKSTESWYEPLETEKSSNSIIVIRGEK